MTAFTFDDAREDLSDWDPTEVPENQATHCDECHEAFVPMNATGVVAPFGVHNNRNLCEECFLGETGVYREVVPQSEPTEEDLRSLNIPREPLVV